MKALNFNCEGQKLTWIKSENEVYTDSRNYLKVNIHFDDDYDDLQKIIVYSYENDDGKPVVLKRIYNDNGINKVPVEVLDLNHFWISLYTLGDTRIATNECLVELDFSGYLDIYEETGLKSIKDVEDLEMMYHASYDYLDYDYAYDYFEKRRMETVESDRFVPAGCSAFFKDGLYGRNLDWYYSKMCSCIIETDDTFGVAGALPEFTTSFLKENTYTDLYKILPFFLQDGVNDDGLCVSTLVIPNTSESSKPTGEVRDSVCSIMLVRYILDNFKTVQQAYEYLREHVEIYFPKTLLEMDYNQHWLLADSTGDYGVIGIDNNATTAAGDDLLVLNSRKTATNFSHVGVKNYGTNDVVYTPFTQKTGEGKDAVKYNNIHPHGQGLERFNLINSELTSANDVFDFKRILNLVRCTFMYDDKVISDKRWYTEFAGDTYGGKKLVCNTSYKDFLPIMKAAHEMYLLRTREPTSAFFGTWNTNHSIIYDLNEREVHIATQEEYDDWKRIRL